MNIFVSIILAIFLIILISLLYKLYVGGSGTSLTPNPLKLLTNGIYTVPSSSLSQLSSSNYTNSIWVFVNTWNTNVPKTIYASTSTPSPVGISYATTNGGISYPLNPNKLQVPTAGSGVFYSLTLDANSPNLYFNVSTRDISNNIPYTIPILITNNFPLQKWTNVIVSVSKGDTFDFYIDGNLVSSEKISPVSIYNTNTYAITQTNVVVNQPTFDSKIILGGDIPAADISVTRFIRYKYSINPQDAKSIYSYGSGISVNNDYNVNISLIKDNNVFREMKLI